MDVRGLSNTEIHRVPQWKKMFVRLIAQSSLLIARVMAAPVLELVDESNDKCTGVAKRRQHPSGYCVRTAVRE